MTKPTSIIRLVAGPALAVALFGPLSGGCSSTKDLAPTCAVDMQARLSALKGAADALVQVSGEMRASVAFACANIATGLGKTPPDVGADGKKATDDDVTAACNLAAAAITAEIQASGQITLTIEGGRCEVNASAQLDCEASCTADASCQPGDVTARCDAAELSVTCQGTCNANATCEGSATVDAKCQGTCDAECTGTCAGSCEGTITGGCTGTCTGTCSGTCSVKDGQGNCAGTCDGDCTGTCTQPAATATCKGKCAASCTGTCSGNCKLDANANIDCGASATCKGGCTGTATAPKCEAKLTPPSCQVDAQCESGCSGQASLKATCTPPTIKVTGSANAQFATVLEANLPALFNAFKVQGKLAAEAAADVATNAAGVATAAATLPGCVAKFGADFFASLQASAQASASVNVSVSASANASGSAGAT